MSTLFLSPATLHLSGGAPLLSSLRRAWRGSEEPRSGEASGPCCKTHAASAELQGGKTIPTPQGHGPVPHLTWLSNAYSALLHLLRLPAMQTPSSFLDVGEEQGAAAKEMMEGVGRFRPLSRVMEEKPVIQEAATEPESAVTGLFFACVCTGTAPCWEPGWAAASLLAPRPSPTPPKCPMGKLSG